MLTRSPSKKGTSTDFPAYELEPVPVTEAICEALGVVPECACIVPYWCKVLGREDITAYQASEREGYLYCREKIERVRFMTRENRTCSIIRPSCTLLTIRNSRGGQQ